MKSRVTLKEEMNFTGELQGFNIMLDADEEFGGKNRGSRPKGLLLTALAGCTAMDVLSILRKMRAEPEEFWVEAEAESVEIDPKVFKSILVTYYIWGKEITEEKAKRAIELSLDKYCSVSAMLKPTIKIDYRLVLK